MRHVVIALACCLLSGGLLQHAEALRAQFRRRRRLPSQRDQVEVSVAAPANMPPQMAERVAAALAIELQSYNIVAAVQPTRRRSRSPAP